LIVFEMVCKGTNFFLLAQIVKKQYLCGRKTGDSPDVLKYDSPDPGCGLPTSIAQWGCSK